MLRYILFDTTLFDDDDQVDRTRADLCWMLEALTQRDMDYLRARPNTVRMYKSHIVYERPAQFSGECDEVALARRGLGANAKLPEYAALLQTMQQVFGGERFRDIGRILERGAVDCDNLCAWRTAELRMAGIPAMPTITHRDQPDGGTVYHALVRWPPFGRNPHWTFEDPSLLLGMGGPGRKADRDEEIRKNAERVEDAKNGAATKLITPAGDEVDAALVDILGMRPRAPAGKALVWPGVHDVDILNLERDLLKVKA